MALPTDSEEVIKVKDWLFAAPEEQGVVPPVDELTQTVPTEIRLKPAATAATQAIAAASPDSRPQTAERPDEQVHAWLRQRIAALQEERQSRWQKVLQYLLGK